MRKLLPAALLLAACTLPGCESGCDPTPECLSGTVVGSTCMDGLLIDVDPRYRIGGNAVLPRHGRPDTLLGRNVIAVVNGDALASLPYPAVGQRLYFTYVNDPDRQWNGLCCFANDGVKTNIPHLLLSNVSTTGCGQAPKSK
ncbi:hypothetical protein [Hymenobacter saemangeumensis]